MGRITEHMDYCFLACYEQQGDKIREECPIYKCCYSRQMHEKLSHYEDLEEQGRLILLPCKVGDTVYFIDRTYNRIIREFIDFVNIGYVKAIKFSARPTKVTIEYDDGRGQGRCKGADYHASNIGKTLFLTKEEAEEKLKELKEGGVNDNGRNNKRL